MIVKLFMVVTCSKFLTDNSLPLNELIYFPTMAVIIRCVFKQNGVFYPQFPYERIDKNDFIDFNKNLGLKNA